MLKFLSSGVCVLALAGACSQVGSLPTRGAALLTGAPIVTAAPIEAYPQSRPVPYGDYQPYSGYRNVGNVAQSYSTAPQSVVTYETAPAAPISQPTDISYQTAYSYAPEPASGPDTSVVQSYAPPAVTTPADYSPATDPAPAPSFEIAAFQQSPAVTPASPRTWRVGDADLEVATNATPLAASTNAAFPRRKPSQAELGEARATTAGDQLRISTRPASRGSYVTGPTPPAIEYNIPHRPQEEPLWCWAAAAQQAIGWVNGGRAPAQCAIVALAHNIPVDECCADREGICAKTGEIPAIGSLVAKFGGYAAEMASVPRDPQQIYNILKGGGTLLIRLRPAPHEDAVGIRHMIVVRGIEWLRLPNNELQATLLYNDPLGADQRAVSFDEIVGFFEQALLIKRT